MRSASEMRSLKNVVEETWLYTRIKKALDNVKTYNSSGNRIYLSEVDMSEGYSDEVIDHVESLGYNVNQSQVSSCGNIYDITISW